MHHIAMIVVLKALIIVLPNYTHMHGKHNHNSLNIWVLENMQILSFNISYSIIKNQHKLHQMKENGACKKII